MARRGVSVEDLTDNPEENDEPKTDPEAGGADDGPEPAGGEAEGKARSVRAFPGLVRTGVRYSLALTGFFLILFMAGSMYPPGVPDALLFGLLRLLRYSAAALCVLSLVALGFGVHRSVYAPGVRNALAVLRYFFFALLGAVLLMFSLLIVAMVGGN